MCNTCTICGNHYSELGYSSALDGEICCRCAKMYFVRAGQCIRSRLYDKQKLFRALNDLGNAEYNNLITAFRYVQSNYRYIIDGFCTSRDDIIIYLSIPYHNKIILGFIIANEKRVLIRIIKDGKRIEKSFNSRGVR